MANNVTLPTGEVIATIDIGGVEYPVIIIADPSGNSLGSVAVPINVRESDGTDQAAIDSSGNKMVAQGVNLTNAHAPTLADGVTQSQKLEIAGENTAVTNFLKALVAKCRTSDASLTNNYGAALSLTPEGVLWVGEKAAGGTATYGQISVGATATLIKAANTSRRRIVVTQHGTTAVYLGSDNSVTSSNGMILAGTVGAIQTFYSAGTIYGITASGSQTVGYFEEVI